MTTEEMVKVMEAYIEGKQIEFKRTGENHWAKTDCPIWNWDRYDYRIKSEPKYVPYDSVSEVERDKWVKSKKSRRLYRISTLDPSDNTVRLDDGWCSLKDLFELFTYEDDTHCGKQVEE